jgi:HEAT repeat protein
VRDPSDVLVQALERAARKAEQPVVRVKAVRVAGEVLPKRPDLKSFLEALAQDSEYEQVRKAATSALGN